MSSLEELISRPRRTTPSLSPRAPRPAEQAAPDTTSRAGGQKDRGTTARMPSGPAGQQGTSAPPAWGRGTSAAPGPRLVTAGLLTLRPDQMAWVRELRVAAIREGGDLALTDLVRVALDRLRAGGATWPQLREAVLAETRERSRRR